MPSSQPPSTLSDLIKSHPLFTRTRLTSLYSDFRPLVHTNPDGYSANISAWLSLLSDATRAGLISNSSLPDTLVLTINASLLSSLASDSQARPLAIGAVICESLKTKELIPLGIFLNQVESIYTSRSYIQAIGGWVLSKLPIPAILIGGSSTSAPNVSEEIINRQTTHYVVVKNLEEAAQQVLAEFSSKRSGRVSEIWTFENFIQEFANPFFNSTKSSKARFSENDAKVLLRYLERDLMEISMSGQTIKFKPTTSPTPIAVTQTDVTIANLKATISITQTSLNNLTSSSNTLTTRAKSHLSASNKPAAIATLRTKKAIDAHIASRASSLTQLETLLFQIETAADNVTLVSLLESGGHALKNLNKEIGSVERVDEVLEKVKEAGEDAEEISRVLNTGLGQEGVVDEEDVEEELEEIMRLQREEETRKGVKEYDRRAKEAEEKARREAEDLASSLEILDLKSPQGEPERRMELENV